MLWQLLLMPFAKSGFPIITLNIISWLIILISSWIYLFKTKINFIFKVLILFTAPFIYTYSSIARNYCLIVLILILIGIYYDKRYDHPIKYSILISFLIYTHSLAWGIVAGLTITFHFIEIGKKIFSNYKKIQYNIKTKQIVIGLLIIAINSIIIVLQLYGTTNSDYAYFDKIAVEKQTKIIVVSLSITAIYTIILARKYWKEYLTIFIGFLFQCYIYIFFYGSILLPRYILVYVIYLFLFIIISKENKISKLRVNVLGIIYLIFLLLFNGTENVYKAIKMDIKFPYSSAKEMATYINENLSDRNVILIDSAILCQTIEPYLTKTKLYDIVYEKYFENIKYMSNEKNMVQKRLKNLEEYKGNYIIISYIVDLDYPLIYTTKSSIMGENYKLYYIE